MRPHVHGLPLPLLATLVLAGCAAPPPAVTPEAAAPPASDAATSPATPPAATASELQPLSPADCAAIVTVVKNTIRVEVTESEAPITDYVSGRTGTGCQAMAKGTGEDFESPSAVVQALTKALEADGWQPDMNLASGGPTGEGTGLRKGNQIALVSAMWQADPAANCPQDQPISACPLTPAQKWYTITVDAGQTTAAPGAGMANPASENCAKQGGTLKIETRGDGGQIGVCYFLDNQQCEEWALMRGDCPVGGVKVTGYVTPAGRYCAITGGTYAITGKSGAADEQGTCTLPGGAVCDAWEYYNGKCGTETGAIEAGEETA